MNVLKVLLIHLTFCFIFSGVHCFLEPFSAFALAMAGIYIYNSNVKEPVISNAIHVAVKKTGQILGFFEGCEDYWIPANINGLEEYLSNNIFGQELAVEIVLASLRHHLKSAPSKPLVISFHGSAGTGKTYISRKILKYMFKNADKSEYVYFFRGALDFPLQREKETYKKTIMKKIKEKVYQCRRSIFVFDEVEKMPNGLLDVLTTIVKTKQEGDYDYRRSIFILLSNIGEKALHSFTLENLKMGIGREDVDKKQLQELLAQSAFNEEGGFQHSTLIKNSVITHYVPFLPLEKKHIIQCLEKEVDQMQQIMSNILVTQVLQELQFTPKGEEIFSFDGCKNVKERAGFFIERQKRLQNRIDY